eukprot:UN06691
MVWNDVKYDDLYDVKNVVIDVNQSDNVVKQILLLSIFVICFNSCCCCCCCCCCFNF